MKNKPNLHHLVLGELKDFLTDDILPDTHDERYRQKIARKLVFSCGFEKREIKGNFRLKVSAGEKEAVIRVDFLIYRKNKVFMIIKYSPGSLVSRRLSAIGLSRIIKPYQIPVAVVTNGEDAEILDCVTGRVLKTGFDFLPSKKDLEKYPFLLRKISPGLFDKASRIVYACEVDGACPCDTDVCIIK